MPEGSVMLDGIDSDVSEETEDQDQNVNNQVESENQGDQDGQQTEGQETKVTQGEETNANDRQVTDKGTKLDSNPMSALNQQLANERARVREYEAFMSDPQQVERYLSELRRERGETTQTPAPKDEISLDQVQTREDVVKFLEQERTKDRGEIESLKQTVNGFMQNQGLLAVGNKIRSAIEDARQKYPVLRPTNPDGSANPDFDPELEQAIGEAYDELDFDPKTKNYRGQVDFLKLVDRFMKAAKRGESQGSKKAQTIVQDRRSGRIVTGSKSSNTQPDESSMTPGQIIASRMARASRR